MSTPTTWPNDADGDVLRRLDAKAFNFAAEYEIDFNVDFEDWPPHPDAVAWLESRYANVTLYKDETGLNGYIQFKLRAKLTYEFVMNTQREATVGTEAYGGICESWGVLHQAA